MDDMVSQAGWNWAHDCLLGIIDEANANLDLTPAVCFDIGAAAVLVAYRAGLRQGRVDSGLEPLPETPFSDTDITEQIERFDVAFLDSYGFRHEYLPTRRDDSRRLPRNPSH